MGGRGTYAAGKDAAPTYETVGNIEGVPVLRGLGNKHNLPEEAHSSGAYIKLDRNGDFEMYRKYDKNHYLTTEIAYHPERNIDKSSKPVLHIHFYDRNFKRTEARPLTSEELNEYRRYFKGISK